MRATPHLLHTRGLNLALKVFQPGPERLENLSQAALVLLRETPRFLFQNLACQRLEGLRQAHAHLFQDSLRRGVAFFEPRDGGLLGRAFITRPIQMGAGVGQLIEQRFGGFFKTGPLHAGAGALKIRS